MGCIGKFLVECLTDVRVWFVDNSLVAVLEIVPQYRWSSCMPKVCKGSPIPLKIWKPIKLKNFGCPLTDQTYVPIPWEIRG